MPHFNIGDRVQVKSVQDITQILAMSYCRYKKPGCGPDGVPFCREPFAGHDGMYAACDKTATITDIRRHAFGDHPWVLVLRFDDDILDREMSQYTFTPWMVSKVEHK